MKDYGHLIDETPGVAATARDVLLAEVEPRAERRPVPMRIRYHDPSHLGHGRHAAG
jgi:glycolate oxidase iron-sulfur subunit